MARRRDERLLRLEMAIDVAATSDKINGSDKKYILPEIKQQAAAFALCNKSLERVKHVDVIVQVANKKQTKVKLQYT
jgi:hypothetical protein